MSNLEPSSFDHFRLEAQRGNVVPVVRTVPAGSRTPVEVFGRLATDAKYAFLLESLEGDERTARYCFLGSNPEMIVRGRENRITVEHGTQIESRGCRFPDFVRHHFSKRKLAHRHGLPPFTGGAVGYFGHGAARWFEPTVTMIADDVTADDAVLMFYRTVIAFDRVQQQIAISSIVLTEEADRNPQGLQGLYHRAVAETEQIENLLMKSPASDLETRGTPGRRPHGRLFSSNWTREGFQQAVALIKDHIAAGDCYQAVLSQRFTREVTAPPIVIYQALREINPSPYMYFLKLGEEAVIGASPEMLVRCRGRRLDYRPIAGTRPRGATKAEDGRLASEMRGDAKELAEHMMLVDLGRNDLGRVSDYGSVQVDDLMSVEAYSHVQHLVSSLRGRLRGDLDRFDAFASCFPAGTVTGAPKLRAMEIVSQLEPDARGIYAGAIVYVDYSDNLDSCIAIRTMVIRDGKASVQAGAGIVADSLPDLEYEETVNKAQALFSAMKLAERKTRRASLHR